MCSVELGASPSNIEGTRIRSTRPTWIPLGLHMDQSNYMGRPVKPSAHKSFNILSSYVANNPICVVSSYVQALLTLRVLEYGVQDPLGFLLDCIWISPTIWAGR